MRLVKHFTLARGGPHFGIALACTCNLHTTTYPAPGLVLWHTACIPMQSTYHMHCGILLAFLCNYEANVWHQTADRGSAVLRPVARTMPTFGPKSHVTACEIRHNQVLCRSVASNRFIPRIPRLHTMQTLSHTLAYHMLTS
jgi:hypothetical protein